jgi:hypothetical protein
MVLERELWAPPLAELLISPVGHLLAREKNQPDGAGRAWVSRVRVIRPARGLAGKIRDAG